MAQIVGKYRGAKSGRKGEAAVVVLTCRFLRRSVAACGDAASGHTDNRRQNGERRGDGQTDPTQAFARYRHHRLLLLIEGAPTI